MHFFGTSVNFRCRKLLWVDKYADYLSFPFCYSWFMAFFKFSPTKIIHSSKLMSKDKERFLRTLIIDDDIIGVCKLEKKINWCCKRIFSGHWNESTSKWSFDMKFVDFSIIVSPFWNCKLYCFMKSSITVWFFVIVAKFWWSGYNLFY